MMVSEYEVAIRSDVNFENLIAEITFLNKKVGIIISQEVSREKFDVGLYSLVDGSPEKFDDTEKDESLMIELNILLSALAEAKSRLIALDEPR